MVMLRRFAGLSAVVFMVWLGRERQPSRALSPDDERGRRTHEGPRSGGEAGPPSEEGEDLFDKYLSQSSADFRRSVRFGLVLALMLAVYLSYVSALTFQARFEPELMLTGVGFAADELLTTVSGTVALVAAVTIAVTSSGARPATDRSVQAAAWTFWADTATGLARVTASVGLALALTTVPSMDRREEFVRTVVVLGIGVFGVVLAAAVVSWTGRQDLEVRRLQREISALARHARGFVLSSPARGNAGTSATYFTLLCGTGAGVFTSVVAGASGGSRVGAALLWLVPFCVLLVFLSVTGCLWRWTDGGSPDRSTRLQPLVAHVVVLIFVAVAGAASVTASDRPSSLLSLLSVMFVTSVGVPTLLLESARRRKRGPGAFAVQMTLDRTLRRQSSRNKELQRQLSRLRLA